MYCKHCGKQIDDDAKFCKFCGGEQQVASSNNKESKKEIVIPTIKTNLTSKQKKWLGIYGIWAILNFICIFIGESSRASNYLFPFSKDDIKYYDFSEFLIYAILIPLVIFFICKNNEKLKAIWKKINSGGANLPSDKLHILKYLVM